MEPLEKMRVVVQNILFENGRGMVVQSYAHESVTLIVNEHLMQDLSETRAFYNFKFSFTNSDFASESISTFWNVQIKLFVYFAITGSKMKLIVVPEVNEGIVTVDFLNPVDAQLFWYYAFKDRRRRNVIEYLIFSV